MNPASNFRALPLPPEVKGRLWLSAMPGRHTPWPVFLDDARRTGLDLLVCLNPLDEIAYVSPAYHSAIVASELPCRWLHLPMRNFALAEQFHAFKPAVEQVARELQGGASVLLHCAAGIGRTGTMAACVLKQLGLPRDEALWRVRDAGSSPESAVQSGLVDEF